MKIILKHIVRNILENRLISFLVICSLVVSTIVIYLNMVIKNDMMLQYKSMLEGTYQDYDTYIYKSNSNSEKDKYFDLKDLDLTGLKADRILGLTRASGVANFNGRLTSVNLYGMNLKLLLDNNLLVLEQTSEQFNPSSEKQIIISSKVAEQFELSLDEEFTVSTMAGEEKMTVGGIAGIKGFYLNENSTIMVFASPQYVGKLNGMGNKVYGVYAQSDGSVKQESFLEQFKSNNDHYTYRTLTDEAAIQAELETTNQLLLIVLAAVVIMVFYLNAGNTKIILAKRMPAIGTIRSIGATRLSMDMILIAENALYGLFSGIIGVVIGISLKEPILSAFSSYGSSTSNLNVPYVFNVWHVIVAIGLTMGFQVLVSLYGILTAGSKSIRETIFNTPHTKAATSKVRSLLGISLLFVACILYFGNREYNPAISVLSFILILAGTILLIPLLLCGASKVLAKIAGRVLGAPAQLGSKSLASNKTTQSSIILVTVTLSIMLTVYLTTISVNNVFKHVGETFEGDIQLTGISEQAEAYTHLNSVEGVVSLQAVYYNFEIFAVNTNRMNIGIFGIDKEMMGIKDISRRMGKLSEGEALIDKQYGIRNHLKMGDTLIVKSDRVKEFTVQIVGYIDSGHFTSSRNVLVLSQSEYKKKISPVPSCIEVETTGDIKKAKESLIQALAGTGVAVQTVDEFLANNKNQVDSLFMMVSLILGLSVVIAFTGVIMNQMIGYMQRKKEIAVLYSVGMSKSLINRMVISETAFTFIIGCLSAGVLGTFLAKALQQILYGIGEYVDIGIDKTAILMFLTGMFIFLMLTTVLTVRKIIEIDVVQEIKYE